MGDVCVKKTIIRIVIIQILILTCFIVLLSMSQPVDITTATQCKIVVETIDYGRRYNELSLYVYEDSIGYMFSKGALSTEYHSVFDISKKINEGDIITITYIEERGIFGKTNVVIDAFSEDESYLSYHQYNSGKRIVRILVSVGFAVLELIFIVISVFAIMIATPSNKRCKKKHKKRTL